MQGFLSIQTIGGTEIFLYMRNKIKARIKGIGTYKSILDTSCHVDLKGCLYVPCDTLYPNIHINIIKYMEMRNYIK